MCLRTKGRWRNVSWVYWALPWGSNVHDLIGTHQGESSSVEVNRDLQEGGRQSFMVGQPASHPRDRDESIPVWVGGEVLIIRSRRLLVQMPVMVGSSWQSGHDLRTPLLNQVLQHLTEVGELLVARHLQRALWRRQWIHISHSTMKIGGRF